MRARVLSLGAAAGLLMVSSCAAPGEPDPVGGTPTVAAPPSVSPSHGVSATPDEKGTHEFVVIEHESFDDPWAMTFLPGSDVLVITERTGRLVARDSGGVREVAGGPEVVAAGQGGLADIIASPDFPSDRTVYLSWVEGDGSGRTGGVVGKATLDLARGELTGLTPIWEQEPKRDGSGHFALRLAIQGDQLFVTSGERQQMSPAQDPANNLGSIVRLTLDGRPAPGNPLGEGPVGGQLYSVGHRNPLGIALDADGRLWSSEMGPQGGDELNLIEPGRNYGWPEVSNGSHYGGGEIPDHAPGDGFEPPKVSWNPSISPGSLMIYSGDLFPRWQGDAFLGALSGQALIRVDLDGDQAVEAENWPMGNRIRAVAEAPDGAIWLLEDGAGARLLELRPA